MQQVDEKTQTIKPVSRCLYCNSTSYGKGCRYAPKGVHFHPSDVKKCSYCGSPAYGRGCRLNPFSDLHLHGIDYNKMFNECVQNRFLLHELNKDFTEFEAYKLGLINEKGEKIKDPVTITEKAALSVETKTILKIKKYLGSKLELINQVTALEGLNEIEYDKSTHKKLLDYEQKISEIFTLLHKTTDAALQDGLTLEQVQALLK